MTDPIEETKAAMTDVKAEISKLDHNIVRAAGYMKVHVAWLIGFGCFVMGLLVGHFLTKHM